MGNDPTPRAMSAAGPQGRGGNAGHTNRTDHEPAGIDWTALAVSVAVRAGLMYISFRLVRATLRGMFSGIEDDVPTPVNPDMAALGGEDDVARRRRSRLREARLNYHERKLISELVDPSSIDTGFDDVGGLEEQIREIRELVLYPLRHPRLFNHSKLLGLPTGILLYGPPGIGKTLLAKTVAKESGAAFLNVTSATLMDKYLGESQKLVEALFTLARKLAPCVIFLDEIDGLLGVRSDRDHPAMVNLKTQFMYHMDGLLTPDPSVSRSGPSPVMSGSGASGTAVSHAETSSQAPPAQLRAVDLPDSRTDDWVLVIAATNRPWAVDPAILRRLPRQIRLSLPGEAARESILRVLLRSERVSNDFDYAELARRTVGFSGSDLKALCRDAVMVPLREVLDSLTPSGLGGTSPEPPRPLATEDAIAALRRVRPTGEAAAAYHHDVSSESAAFTGAGAQGTGGVGGHGHRPGAFAPTLNNISLYINAPSGVVQPHGVHHLGPSTTGSAFGDTPVRPAAAHATSVAGRAGGGVRVDPAPVRADGATTSGTGTVDPREDLLHPYIPPPSEPGGETAEIYDD